MGQWSNSGKYGRNKQRKDATSKLLFRNNMIFKRRPSKQVLPFTNLDLSGENEIVLLVMMAEMQSKEGHNKMLTKNWKYLVY